MKCRKSAFPLSLLALLCLCAGLAHAVPADDPGAPPTNQMFPALYVQNVFLKFMLDCYGKSDAEKVESVKNAEKVIARFAFQPRYIQQVATLQEYGELKARYFPDSSSVHDEVQTMLASEPPAYFLVTTVQESVQDELDREASILRSRFAELSAITQYVSNAAKSNSVRKTLYGILAHPEEARQTFALVPDSARLQLVNAVHLAFKKALSKIDSVGEHISTSIKMKKRGQQRFFEIVLGEYFKGLSSEMKLNMIASFIDHPEAQTNRERFDLMVMAAGPQFQKMLQAYAREKGMNAELKDSLKKLEQSTKAAPWRLVKDSIYGQKTDFKWLEIKQKAIAAGTMAQVHKAKIQLQDGTIKSVAVRVLKPGIKARVLEDSKALQHIAKLLDSDPILIEENFPKLSPFLKQIEDMTTRELNVALMVQANAQGAQVYTGDLRTPLGKIGLQVPYMISLGPDSPVSVQDWVEGVSFEEFSAKHPELARSAVEELAKKWLGEALFGGGFYHADLHQGNLRVSFDPKDNSPILNILDFGMAGTLSRDLQNKFLAFGALVESRNPELMAKIIWELSVTSENSITRDRLQEILAAEISRQDAVGMTKWPFYEWAALAVNSGIRFPPELTSLNRGAFFVFRMLEDQKSKITLPKIIADLVMHNPIRTAKVIQSTESVSKSDWARALFGQVQGLRKRKSGQSANACNAAFGL